MCKETIGRIIKYHRLQKNMTQEQLGFELNSCRQYIHRIEKGEINITADYLQQIITKLGCSNADFFITPPNPCNEEYNTNTQH